MAWAMTPNAPSTAARARWRGAPSLIGRNCRTVWVISDNSCGDTSAARNCVPAAVA